MANYKIDTAKLNKIVSKTVEAINTSKHEIYDIAESARRECRKLEEELQQLKVQVKELIDRVEVLERDLKEGKRRLMLVNKNFDRYSQEELKNAYEEADNLRVELAVKREQEQYLIKRRNDLEVRIKEAFKTVEKADNLISTVAVALGYLTGDLMEVSQQLEDVQQKRFLGYRIIKAQEEERQRVAREIHDGPAQSMSNVVLKAELCEKLIDVDAEKVQGELKNLKRIARDCLQDVRRIIYNLRPMSLDDLGLVPTLQRFIGAFSEESGVSAEFKVRGTCEDIKPVISLTVFRIVQEAINNISKYAKARNVIASLEFTEQGLSLYIYDDGQGFDMETINRRSSDISTGFGLINMRERVELLNGEFSLNSEPGKGTRINIKIPLTQEEGVTNESKNTVNDR